MGLRLCFAFLKIYQICMIDKAARRFRRIVTPNMKEVIAICNTPGIPFFRFLISFGPFAVSPGAIRRPVSARHCLRMPQMQPYNGGLLRFSTRRFEQIGINRVSV